MKKGLEAAGFSKTHLATQPLGFMVPDVARVGYNSLPEYPYGE